MIDKLMEKYNHELNTLAIIGGNHESDTLNIQYDTYKEFIKDLEELKEKINNLDITSINAPSIVITQMLKNEIIGVDIDE